jgi:hypothetical protein
MVWNTEKYVKSVVKSPLQSTTRCMGKFIIDLDVILVYVRRKASRRPNHVGYQMAIKRNHIVKSVGSRLS